MDEQKMDREMCDKAKCLQQDLGSGTWCSMENYFSFSKCLTFYQGKNGMAGQWCQMT